MFQRSSTDPRSPVSAVFAVRSARGCRITHFHPVFARFRMKLASTTLPAVCNVAVDALGRDRPNRDDACFGVGIYFQERC